MKEFKVFKKAKCIVEYRLSIDNRIVESTSKETLQKLIETWLNKIQVNGKVKVYSSKTITIFIDKYFTNVYQDEENCIIDLYKTEPQYDIIEI